MIGREFTPETAVLTAKAAKGAGTAFYAAPYRHKELVISTTGMGVGDEYIVKIVRSESETPPTWVDGSGDPAAVTPTNKYSFVALKDLDSGNTVAGSTGVTFAATNTVKSYEINDNGGYWYNVLVTTYTDANTSGSVYASIRCYND